MNVIELLSHPQPHIRAQARIVLEGCPELDIERERAQLESEVREYQEFLDRNRN